jgi:hypothetical protein
MIHINVLDVLQLYKISWSYKYLDKKVHRSLASGALPNRDKLLYDMFVLARDYGF